MSGWQMLCTASNDLLQSKTLGMRQINLSKIMDSLKIKKNEINQTETINNSS